MSNRSKARLGVVGAILVLLVVAQLQPWAFSLKPLGPMPREVRHRLMMERKELVQELRMLRPIARLQNGGTLPTMEVAAERNPAIASYKARSDELRKREDAFKEKYPEFGDFPGW